MLPHLQCDIVRQCADAVAQLTCEMQNEAELFASPNTLQHVETHLLTVAQTLSHLTPALQARLAWVDWRGWQALGALLEAGAQSRSEAVWYAVRSLLPTTVHLIEQLRRIEPVWFENAY